MYSQGALPFHTAAIFRGLNLEQRAVVEHLEGPLFVPAGSGTGKTTTLTRRIANLIEAGANPSRILAVTFSRKGAEGMNARLDALLGSPVGTVSTFHALALKILRTEKRWRPEDGWEGPDTEHLYYGMLKQAVGWSADESTMNWKGADPTYLQRLFAFAKVSLLKPDSPAFLQLAKRLGSRRSPLVGDPHKAQDAFRRTEVLRLLRKVFTFDDLVAEVVRLFEDESTRLRWASRWDYLLQDECQDQSPDQHKLAELLARDHKNYMVVGDFFQCVHSWRGASVQTFLAFPGAWGATVQPLCRNYRSGTTIVAMANRVQRKMASLLQGAPSSAELVPDRDTPGVIEGWLSEDFDAEGERLAARLKALNAQGVRWRDMAVLTRARAQSRAPEEAFLSAGVPHFVLGGVSFYERKEVKDVLAWLRVLSDRASWDDFARTLSAPNRYVGKVTIKELQSYLKAATGMLPLPWQTWAQGVTGFCETAKLKQGTLRGLRAWADTVEDLALRKLPPVDVLGAFFGQTSYLTWLQQSEGEDTPESSRVSNVLELARTSARFPTIPAFLDHIAEVLWREREAKKNGQPTEAVTIATIHKAKGAEWDVVAVLGVNNNLLPHIRADDPEEERRIFYVGITRAKDHLILSAVRGAIVGQRFRPLAPSPFLSEARVTLTDEQGEELVFTDDPTELLQESP